MGLFGSDGEFVAARANAAAFRSAGLVLSQFYFSIFFRCLQSGCGGLMGTEHKRTSSRFETATFAEAARRVSGQRPRSRQLTIRSAADLGKADEAGRETDACNMFTTEIKNLEYLRIVTSSSGLNRSSRRHPPGERMEFIAAGKSLVKTE